MTAGRAIRQHGSIAPEPPCATRRRCGAHPAPSRGGPLGRAAILLTILGATCPGGVWSDTPLDASTGFVQVGTQGATHAATFGLTWDWSRSWTFDDARVTGYTEASAAYWTYPGADGQSAARLGQFAVIPVLRYWPQHPSQSWFTELGIGVTLTSIGYHTGHSWFSTRANFGDHLAIGRTFGVGDVNEIALRVEHFSNGAIREPNPGATFIQLRYARRFANDY